MPLAAIAPFTGTELSKMAYAAALGSKSVALSLPGLIGYSLPAYFFFHMSSYYMPDYAKPVCNVCKYVVGAPVWIASSITDHLTGDLEERIAGEAIPIDITHTGGTIPNDLGDINQLRETLTNMKGWAEEGLKSGSKKTY